MKRSSPKRSWLLFSAVAFLALLFQARAQENSEILIPSDPDPANLRAFIELVRAGPRTQKALVLAQHMDFTQDEAVEFWPLHREYDLELSKVYDKRLAIIKKYISTYDSLTEDQARTLADESLSLENDRTELKRKYFKKFSQVITAKKALRFFQIENQLNSAIDLRIAASLPLIK